MTFELTVRLFPFTLRLLLLWKLRRRGRPMLISQEAVGSRGCCVLTLSVVLGLCACFPPVLEERVVYWLPPMYGLPSVALVATYEPQYSA